MVICAAVLLLSSTAFFPGCGEGARTVSDPARALLGHWKPASPGRADIYFDLDKATYVPAGAGDMISVPYEVIEKDAGERWVRLAYGKPGTEREPFVIRFSEDWRRLFIDPSSVPETLEYIYVDDRRDPLSD